MYRIVFIRHGQSLWNKENRFTGWIDVDLTEQGINEARLAGELLKNSGYKFDIAYTSVLKRAIRTLWHVQDKMDIMYLPVVHSWRLNERHYGALSGLSKLETAKKFGDEQVMTWRRSYDIKPPALEKNDAHAMYKDSRYSKLLYEQLPLTESLRDTVERTLPLWNRSISTAIKDNKQILIVAHGNSIRGLIKHLDGISNTNIMNLNIPNGIPIVYELDEKLNPIQHRYLSNIKEIEI